ncbi:MAG: hypothetical protein ACYDBJ_04830 [Aggregatilineales bacterium]
MNRKVKINSRVKKGAVVVATAVVMIGVAGIGIANAQSQGGRGGPGFGPIGFGVATVCSVTNYDDVAAQALNMQSPALRQALVSGKTLEQIASGQNVTFQTVENALKTAYEADLSQALKDGLITQQEYDGITSRLNSAPGNAANATPQATQNATPDATQSAAPNAAPPRIHRPNGPGMPFLRVPAYNEVNSFVVASKAIGISCADMVKAMEGGQSIAQVTTGKNVQAQTVIDALVSAEKAAIAQDVQEGLLSQAEADGRLANVTNRVGALVYNAGLRERGPFGQGGFPGGRPPRGGNDNGPQGPNNGPAPQTPAPAGSSS